MLSKITLNTAVAFSRTLLVALSFGLLYGMVHFKIHGDDGTAVLFGMFLTFISPIFLMLFHPNFHCKEDGKQSVRDFLKGVE